MKASLITLIKYPSKQMRRLYNWTLSWSESPYAYHALFILAFAESSFFPIPPDVLLLALVVGKPKNYVKLFLIATLGSVSGSLLGYFLGYTFYETLGIKVVELYSLADEIQSIGAAFSDNAIFTILISSFTPIPYKVITISAGLFKINLVSLLTFSFIGRGARFFIVSFLTQKFGVSIKNFIEKYFDILGLILLILIGLGFIALKFL